MPFTTPGEKAQYDQDAKRVGEHLDQLIAMYRLTKASGYDQADCLAAFTLALNHGGINTAQVVSSLWAAICRLGDSDEH